MEIYICDHRQDHLLNTLYIDLQASVALAPLSLYFNLYLTYKLSVLILLYSRCSRPFLQLSPNPAKTPFDPRRAKGNGDMELESKPYVCDHKIHFSREKIKGETRCFLLDHLSPFEDS